ncbi:MAG: magnesium/cobalt transporter CorA [Anaerolineales bacterium]
MIRSIYFAPDSTVHTNLSRQDISDVLQQPKGLLWVSLEQPTPDEFWDVLRDIFKFHPLAIEDCQSIGYQTPKIDDFGQYLFIIVHAIRPDQNFQTLETMELDIFLGSNYVVTHSQNDKMPPIDYTWHRIHRDERLHSNGSDFLCHAILDALVDDYMPLIDQMAEEIEELEDRVIARPNVATLQRILDLKHTIMSLRRIVGPQREIVNRLSRDDFALIDRQSRIYFRDVYDHLVRIQDMSETIRDIVSSALDIYLNSTSLRLNEIMKALTIVSTIFLPLTFLAGVYGMNFKYMPELSMKLAYPAVWVVFLIIAIGMLVFFKRRGWF